MTDKNTKHTPGPWNISPLSLSGEDSGVYIYSGMMQIVGVLRRPDSTVTWANARLIAAAPDMADILLRSYTHVSHGGPTYVELEEVLKRAGIIEGEQP
jgi:hypothetical protein